MSNKLFCIVGESASGKNVIVEKLLEKYPIDVLISNTTRPIRSNETDGVDYRFTTKEHFTKHFKQDNILEYATYTIENFDTWFYYTLISDLKLDKHSQIKIVNPLGNGQIKAYLKDKVVTIYITCDEEIRKQRYLNRCETPDKFENRLERDRKDFANLRYDYKIVNDGNRTLDEITNEIIAIIENESK